MSRQGKKGRKRWIVLGIAAAAVILAALAFLIVQLAARSLVGEEMSSREDWGIETGSELLTDQQRSVGVYEAGCEASIPVIQMVPLEYEDEAFTYYDESVQQRLAQTLLNAMERQSYPMEAPLAVLNPFGTGSNSLLLAFETDQRRQIRYTIHVEDADIPDFTATANNGGRYTRLHCFQVIGLVPGEVNEVTLQAVGEQGNVQKTVSFTIEMPQNTSGYDTVLRHEDGESGEPLTEGLFYLTGVGDYYGYTFFFDNHGVMRYEMVLEGYHSDRFLFSEHGLYTCVGSRKVALLNPLGQAVRVYDLGQYELHHDINWGPEGTILALVTDTEQETVMDVVVELDLETGAVTELLDFSELMSGYHEMTRPITATDPFFWQAGEDDWLHLNSIEYREEDDSILVSSRETSTIVRVAEIHGEPELSALIGDARFWADTDLAAYSYRQSGDFVPQYGQHDVEYVFDDSLPEGQYYLRMYNNNYWGLSTRDGYDPEMDSSVGTIWTGQPGISSYVTWYLVDEKAGTFSLAGQWAVPYSSVVSNAQALGDHYVVNSGVALTYGEYDQAGRLIRSFRYEGMMNGYRAMKDSLEGYWFEGEREN